MRVELPAEIEAQMKLYRLDLCGMPKGYIDFHLGLARAALEALKGEFIVRAEWVEGDGWFDGMKVLFVIVEPKKRSHKLYKLHWHDGNQEFFVYSQNSGGSFPFHMRDALAA